MQRWRRDRTPGAQEAALFPWCELTGSKRLCQLRAPSRNGVELQVDAALAALAERDGQQAIEVREALGGRVEADERPEVVAVGRDVVAARDALEHLRRRRPDALRRSLRCVRPGRSRACSGRGSPARRRSERAASRCPPGKSRPRKPVCLEGAVRERHDADLALRRRVAPRWRHAGRRRSSSSGSVSRGPHAVGWMREWAGVELGDRRILRAPCTCRRSRAAPPG